MKKIIATLFSIGLFSLQQVSAQTNITVTAPSQNGYASMSLPTGMSSTNYSRGCFLIRQTELSALLTTNITSFGFALAYGTGVSPASGTITIYLQNTNDNSYLKPQSFTTAISAMTNVYSGNMLIPAITNSTVISFNLPGGFTYTGGGLYVAFDYTATTSVTNSNAWYETNIMTVNMGAYKNSQANNPNFLANLNPSVNRPVCVFDAVNNATNEASVRSVNVQGKLAESLHVGQIITADVKNESINTLNNLNVSLNVMGANPFTDTQVISSIAPGAMYTVTFAPFQSYVLGTNNVFVSLPSDQNNLNNQVFKDQLVSCNELGYSPAAVSYSNSFGNQNGPVMVLSRYNLSSAATLKAVNLAISPDWGTMNATACGVLLDNNGAIIATTNTININQSIFNTMQTLTYTSPQLLSPNQDYYIGMAESIGYFMAANIAQVPADIFYSANINGGNLQPVADAYFGIHAVLAGPEITITQASTVICNGEYMTLFADGASTFTWSSSVFNPIDDPYNYAITVMPTSNETYSVFAMDEAGCTNSASAPLAVKPCLGIPQTAGLQAIQVYPNPAINGKATLTGLSGKHSICVYTILGEILVTKEVSEETVSIDLSGKPAGNYFVKVTDPDNNIKTFKLLIQE